MKSFTDITQSKRLAKLLPIESADMWYWEWPTAPKYNNYEHPMFHKGDNIVNVPCWSLAALFNYLREIDFFPEIDVDESTVTMNITYYNKEDESLLVPIHNIKVKAENFVDACYEIILKLKLYANKNCLKIMDYERKYKEALKWMQSLYGGLHGATKEEAEKYFPELKESEDEQSKKWILEYLHDGLRKSDEQFKGQFKTAIAWLEKQGEKKHIINVSPREVILSIWDLGNEWKELTNGCISTEYGTQLDYIQKHWHESEYYLKEKRGKQTQLDYEHADIFQKDFAPIEPKFKVGDWIIATGEVVYQIKVIQDTNVALVETNGDESTFDISVLDDAKLWTIKDAKDGDLIYVSTEIKGIQAIFHKFENGIIYFHCNLCSDFTQGGYEPSGDVEFVSPLQKIHYQKFFQKMKEAGYEWDSDKKELKKIEQKKLDTDKVIE